jgi:hypothetical protein
VALAAIVKSNRDLVRERRTTHELDVLRGIAESLKTFGGSSLPQFMRTYLLMLPGEVDFPVARAEFDVRATDDGRRRLALMKQDAPPESRRSPPGDTGRPPSTATAASWRPRSRDG